MSSEEEDYMSASFVVDSTAQDVRPGLILKRSQQRDHEILKKKLKSDLVNKNAYRPLRVVEAERREEGLQSAISSSNKGFALLQKMGYKPGTGIGKTGTGRVEPIPFSVKSDRQGLGRAAALQELAERKRLLREKRRKRAVEETITPEEFRARMTQRAAQRYIDTDLRKSQKMCHTLDEEQGIAEPAEKWFWPAPPPNSKKKSFSEHDDRDERDYETPCKRTQVAQVEHESSDEDSDEDEFEASEKLEMITKYLRTTYNYCIWCCVKFENNEDMEKECPGTVRNDH